ncbi:MAG: B12-binding domain-containing protein [Phycisphaerae bacterium]
MLSQGTLEKYLETLLSGDRVKSRSVVEEALQSGVTAHNVYLDLIWPAMVEIEKLIRSDKITSIQEHLATRINRTIVDQLQNKLPRRQKREKRVVICCAQDQLQELGAQMMTDLFESDGWEVRFVGGGLNNDDILEYINDYAPKLLIIYGAQASQAPGIRALIDTIRNVNAWPDMRIMVSGGLFNRAEGLWEEIGADMFAENASQALQNALTDQQFNPDNRTVKRKKRSSDCESEIAEEISADY